MAGTLPGLRKALTRTELSRTALGMVGALGVDLRVHLLQELVVLRLRAGPDPLVPAEDGAEVIPGLGPIDHRDRLEQHPAFGHFEVEVVALLELERLARRGRQGDLPAAQQSYQAMTPFSA